MGCWGITAFESDAGLDSVSFIREQLPKDGNLELGKIIKALQCGECRLPEVKNAESHTSPMAMAEIIIKFLDRDTDGLDYDEEWAAKDNKFSAITSFTASKESIGWIRDYLSDTLHYAKKMRNSEPNTVKNGAAGSKKRTGLAGRSIWQT